jgi:adenylosuccinate lyase
MDDIIEDVLGGRYASPPMKKIWGPSHQIIVGRELWIAILTAQRDLGMSVPAGAVEAYEQAKDQVDLASIRARELERKHDQLAQIEEFNALAGFEVIHQGNTSRDKQDNVDQVTILRALKVIEGHSYALLARFARRSREYQHLFITGRSHLIPGQTTTLGKRIATITEEFLESITWLRFAIARYPMRGIKGAMGTRQDMIDRLESKEKARELEDRVRKHLGFRRVLKSTGQIYSRTFDYHIVSILVELGAAASNFAMMIRHMAGLALASEGTAPGQKGSSAMPHKTGKNPRTSERINGLLDVLHGFHDMVSRLIGKQWFEGDVSDSVVRRVALQGAFLALDGLFEAAMHVLDKMKIYRVMIDAELERELPFLSTSALLMASLKKGVGREEAHSALSQHAVTAATAVGEGKPSPFATLVSRDPVLKLTRDEVEQLITPNVGDAEDQVDEVLALADRLLRRNAEAAAYNPAPLV